MKGHFANVATNGGGSSQVLFVVTSKYPKICNAITTL